jgi:hypothetical protein
MRLEIQNIDARTELEKSSWFFEEIGDNEVRAKCPFHSDDRPSVAVNTEKNVFRCFACKEKGDLVKLLAKIHTKTRSKMIDDLQTRYDLKPTKSIRPDVVEKYHDKIRDAGKLLVALRERGVTDEILRVNRIGYDDGRITIPVYDLAGRVVNIRRYLPGGTSDRKMRNTPGYGGLRLYKLDKVVKSERVWICGGEIKAAVVDNLLEDKGIGACSATGGEGSWSQDWNKYFENKSVWICMDVDKPGKAAALKIAAYLATSAKSVRIIKLPLDTEKYPKGDINDYVGKLKASADDLVRLMDLAEDYVPTFVEEDIDKGIKEVTLNGAPSPFNVGWRLRFEAVSAAMDTTPYLVPAEIYVSCDREQANCAICPVKMVEPDESGFVKKTVPTTGFAVLEMVNVGKNSQKEAIREALRIPRCKTVDFDVRSHMSALDVRLSPKLELTSRDSATKMQPCVIVNAEPEMNEPYLMEGKVYPHPRSQQATLVVDKIEKTEDGLSSFNPTKEELDPLKQFVPKSWTIEGLDEKLSDIYEDLEVNVTRIFGRRQLHLVLDLVYHSPLFLSFENRRVNGWVSALVMGDSAQGKSETTLRLQEHYGLGERIDCKNATVAGLLGGLQQLGNRWFVSWGVIPQHDRRLVILEELKGASAEVFSKLTDMRSSGIAEIPKIERRRTHARTRMICVSNPRSSRPMSAYNFGVEAIVELIGSLEDVRRFDITALVASGEVPVEAMHCAEVITHRFTSEICRRLILWGWTRKPEQIVFEDTESINKSISRLCSMFTESLPLVDRGTMKYKLARLSAALAIRTFSTNDGKTVQVRKCHIDYISKLIEDMYSSPIYGYLDFSRAQRDLNRLVDREKLEKFITQCTKFPYDLVTGLLYKDSVTLQDIQDLCGVDRDTAQTVISFFVRNHALKRGSRHSYSKTAEFIDFLKGLKVTNQDEELFLE